MPALLRQRLSRSSDDVRPDVQRAHASSPVSLRRCGVWLGGLGAGARLDAVDAGLTAYRAWRRCVDAPIASPGFGTNPAAGVSSGCRRSRPLRRRRPVSTTTAGAARSPRGMRSQRRPRRPTPATSSRAGFRNRSSAQERLSRAIRCDCRRRRARRGRQTGRCPPTPADGVLPSCASRSRAVSPRAGARRVSRAAADATGSRCGAAMPRVDHARRVASSRERVAMSGPDRPAARTAVTDVPSAAGRSR